MVARQLSVAVFQEFQSLLSERLLKRVRTTEDSIRYTFFASMMKSGIRPHEVVLEYEHPAIRGAEIDMVLMDAKGLTCAIEFKYDRRKKSTSPKPQKAGKLFHDLSRLLQVQRSISRYFVYVTDKEMADYLAKPSHGVRDFFEIETGGALQLGESYFAGLCKTFHEEMGIWPGIATVRAVHVTHLPHDHHLRIYGLARPE